MKTGSTPTVADSFLRRLAEHAAASPPRVALCEWGLGSPRLTSYAELYTRALRFASFVDQHARPKSIVPLLMGKSAESVSAMIGVLMSGRAFCFVNPKFRGPQIAAVMKACGPDLCFVDQIGLNAVRGMVDAVTRTASSAWAFVGESTGSRLELEVLAQLRTSSKVYVDATGWRDSSDEPERPLPAFEPTDVGACLFTSGSSGEPKGVLVGVDDLVRRLLAEVDWFALCPDDVLLNVLPFSFDVGLNQLFSALYIGAELVILSSWLPADMLSAVAQRSVSGIAGVPTIWQDLLRSGLAFDRSGPHRSLRYVTVSGGSLPVAVLERLRSVIDGAFMYKTYGQTETFRSTSLRPEDFDRKPESVGAAFSGVRVYVVREDGTRCAPGEIGEIVHTGLGVMQGYLGNRQLSEDELRKLRPNPFAAQGDDSPLAVFTGDLGWLDHEGFLFLKGRRDSMVKIQGNRVYPQEVTEQVLSIAGVWDAVVVRDPQNVDHDSLVAFVVVQPGLQLTRSDIRRELVKRLPSYMIPEKVVFVNSIPRTLNGKADVGQLCEARPASA